MFMAHFRHGESAGNYVGLHWAVSVHPAVEAWDEQLVKSALTGARRATSRAVGETFSAVDTLELARLAHNEGDAQPVLARIHI